MELHADTKQSKQSRKYLGDPHDPHFVPGSPLIERRKLTARDEEELKQMCTLALSNVPHSDEMTDDPFRYLVKHIAAQPPKPSNRNVKKEPEKISENLSIPTEIISSGNDTATPSETSKRETLQTNDTTPMTTPGVTPGESGKRFSDVGKRPITAHPSSLRTEVTTETKTFKGNAVYSFLNETFPAIRPQTAATKSLTHLPTLSKTKSKSNAPAQLKQTQSAPMGKPDFNKSLPAIPKHPIVDGTSNDDDDAPKERMKGITRLLKTVRLQKTQAPPTLPQRSTSSKEPRALQQMSDNTAAKKHRFDFASIFSKRSNPNPKRATVG